MTPSVDIVGLLVSAVGLAGIGVGLEVNSDGGGVVGSILVTSPWRSERLDCRSQT